MIYLGADHRGYQLKEEIKLYLKEKKIKFIDLGNDHYDENDDYVDFALAVAKKVSSEKKSFGILICGSGIGMSIVANKFKNIRAGLCLSPWLVKDARKDDDINILCLAADYTDPGTAIRMVEVFLKTDFEKAERRIRRIKKIKEIEKKLKIS